jgi:hypothetical protein
MGGGKRLDRPRLEFAIESSADEVWPQACNSPSQGGNFEGIGGLTEWRMCSRLRVDGTRFEEAICVALCSLSGKKFQIAKCRDVSYIVYISYTPWRERR